MPTQLFQFETHPNDIAVTKTEFVSGGMFFLDFSRPLERLRWFGVLNYWVGFTAALSVPVVHEGEHSGGYVIGIHRSDPYFKDVLTLWKARYPSKRSNPEPEADGLKIVTDFAAQFPGDCQLPNG